MGFHAAMERCCDAVEHGEGVPFVVGVFEAADDGGSGAHQLGKGALGKACLAAEVVDFAGDGVVGADLLKGGDVSANVEVLPGDVILIPESYF